MAPTDVDPARVTRTIAATATARPIPMRAVTSSPRTIPTTAGIVAPTTAVVGATTLMTPVDSAR